MCIEKKNTKTFSVKSPSFLFNNHSFSSFATFLLSAARWGKTKSPKQISADYLPQRKKRKKKSDRRDRLWKEKGNKSHPVQLHYKLAIPWESRVHLSATRRRALCERDSMFRRMQPNPSEISVGLIYQSVWSQNCLLAIAATVWGEYISYTIILFPNYYFLTHLAIVNLTLCWWYTISLFFNA